MKKFWILSLILVATLVLGSQSPSYATLKLYVDDLAGHSVTITDNGAGDLNPNVGLIVWSGTLGVWSVIVDTSQTMPFLGNGTNKIDFDLNNVATSTGAGKLLIATSEVGYTGTITGGMLDFLFQTGGTTSGTMNFVNSYVDNGNVQWGTTDISQGPVIIDANAVKIKGFGPFPAGAFSASGSSSVSAIAPFALTIAEEITQTGPGTTSLDTELKVPEPTTLILLGFGLVGAGLYSRIRRPKR